MVNNLYTDGEDLFILSVYTDAQVEKRIAHFGTQVYINKLDEDIFKAGTSFESIHHQTKHHLSDMALFAEFLMLCWNIVQFLLLCKKLYLLVLSTQ